MIKEVIRLFTGFDYGLRSERLIIPNHLVGEVDDVETVSDACPFKLNPDFVDKIHRNPI